MSLKLKCSCSAAGPGSLLVMEYLDMSRCSAQAALGRQLAELHLHNTGRGAGQRVDSFGFQVDTCCGFLPQANTWAADWVQFYTNKVVKRPSFVTCYMLHIFKHTFSSMDKSACRTLMRSARGCGRS